MSSTATPPRPAGERIAKLLARAGIASRREIERMIADGRVAVNGAVLDTPATVLPSLAGVTVDGQPVADAPATRLFVYHKPPGLLVTERDPAGRPTIYDRLPRDLPRLVPVGRLDLATEGLLLLTTDGGLKRQLELPATGVERAYRARAYGAVTQAQLESLIDGVEIEGVRYGKIDANLERRTGANVWIEMILTEGKNREVRRVLEHLDLRVSRLIRTRYGPFVLGDLPVGEVGEVPARELEAFRKNPKALPPARVAASRDDRVAAGPKPSFDRAPRPERREPERARLRVQPSDPGIAPSAPRPARPGAKPASRVGPERSREARPPAPDRPSGRRPSAPGYTPIADVRESRPAARSRPGGQSYAERAAGDRERPSDRTEERAPKRPSAKPPTARPPKPSGPPRPTGPARPGRGPAGGRGHPPRNKR